jgi:hypothetical protein
MRQNVDPAIECGREPGLIRGMSYYHPVLPVGLGSRCAGDGRRHGDNVGWRREGAGEQLDGVGARTYPSAYQCSRIG